MSPPTPIPPITVTAPDVLFVVAVASVTTEDLERATATFEFP